MQGLPSTVCRLPSAVPGPSLAVVENVKLMRYVNGNGTEVVRWRKRGEGSAVYE